MPNFQLNVIIYYSALDVNKLVGPFLDVPLRQQEQLRLSRLLVEGGLRDFKGETTERGSTRANVPSAVI